MAGARDPPRYDTLAGRVEPLYLTFAHGSSLVLRDPRRQGRIRLNPDIDALGPDATQVTPTEFRVHVVVLARAGSPAGPPQPGS